MSEYVEISTEKLSVDIGEMYLAIQTAEQEIGNIYDAISVLNTMWTGVANSRFNESFNADYEEAMVCLRNMKDFVARMDDCRRKYEQCESEIGDEVHGMD